MRFPNRRFAIKSPEFWRVRCLSNRTDLADFFASLSKRRWLARGAVKEYLIGTEVYERKPSYHPGEDSIVRSEARRLRRKLIWVDVIPGW